jgi:hypothetical protein
MAIRKLKRKKTKTVIKNYGLMWRRDGVFWGKGGGGNKGSLQGQNKRRVIDFRKQIGVYVLYDETRSPVYVGQAGQGNARLFNRLRNHQRDYLGNRWHYFSWFGLLSVNKNGRLSGHDNQWKHVTGTIRSTLNEIEGVLIAATEPRFNKQGAQFRGIARYRQIPRDDDENVSSKELRDLLDKVIRKVDTLRKRSK